ncbi:MAG TPA: PAS domain S-box protein, partial [Blastocatellia bacterium]|nr:PAS domain S-box protein [Blastocatellia bacterium]
YRGLLPDNDLSHRSSAAGTITALNSITAEPARAEPEKAASSPPRNGFGQLTPLLRGLLDNTAAIVYLLDADERYLFVNRRWEEVFHMSSDQVSGKTMYDVFPRQIAEAFHLVNEAVRRTGKQIETEEVAPHDDGFHTYISLKFPFLDEEGNPRAVCGISTDITERKKAEEELRASKESFQRLFEDSPFPFWEMDMSGVKKYIDGLRSQGVEPVAYLREKPEAVLRCVRATRSVRFNKATLRLNGAETEAALLEWFSRALADKSQMHLSNFRDLVLSLAEGKSSFELRGVASVMNGGLINYMCRAIILPGCEDTWSRVLISTLDLTNNVRAEETKAYLAAIVESSGDAIIGSTIDGKIKSWNKGAERVYGYSAEEAIGRSVAFLMPSDRIDDFGSITETLRSGKSVEQYETVRGAKDGRRIYVSLTVSPIKDSQGVITGSSAVARDITEQKRAENDLREAKERYETLFQEAPVSLYELDLSGTKQKLDELRAAGVTDIDSYFDNNPGDLTECALRYQLIRANKTTLKLQGAGSFEDLAHWIQDALRDESGLIRRIFRDVIVTLNSGPTIYEAERVATTLGGNQTDILTRVMIAPGYEDSWASVLVSAIDLTDLRRAEEARSQLAVIVES